MSLPQLRQITYFVVAPATATTKERLKLVTRIKTPEQVLAEFARLGVSVRAWAQANEFSPSLVQEILGGKSNRKCLRGQSHKIAVRLGLKKGEITISVKNAL